MNDLRQIGDAMTYPKTRFAGRTYPRKGSIVPDLHIQEGDMSSNSGEHLKEEEESRKRRLVGTHFLAVGREGAADMVGTYVEGKPIPPQNEIAPPPVWDSANHVRSAFSTERVSIDLRDRNAVWKLPKFFEVDSPLVCKMYAIEKTYLEGEPTVEYEIIAKGDEDGGLKVYVPEGMRVVAKLAGAGNGNIEVTGDGDADAVRLGPGNGSSWRTGPGDGDAICTGNGDGDARCGVDGFGGSMRGGNGKGNSVRFGKGPGNSTRLDDGDGLAMREGEGAGRSVKGGKGLGDSVRRGDGDGNAWHQGNGPGEPQRYGAGEGEARYYFDAAAIEATEAAEEQETRVESEEGAAIQMG